MTLSRLGLFYLRLYEKSACLKGRKPRPVLQFFGCLADRDKISDFCWFTFGPLFFLQVSVNISFGNDKPDIQADGKGSNNKKDD